MNYLNKFKACGNILNILLILYFFLGMQKNIFLLRYIDYILAIIIQIYYLFLIKKNKESLSKDKLFLYLFNLAIIFLIFIIFIFMQVNVYKILFRVLPLISIFGFLIITGNNKYYNVNEIIKNVIFLYGILGIIILMDSIIFYIFQVSLWPPQYYLGNRFSGPFYDPNFLSITYSFFFIVLFYNKEFFGKYWKYLIIIFSINILLGMSWSSIIILLLSFLTSKILSFQNMFNKQIFIFLIYFFIIISFSFFAGELQNIFVNIFEPLKLFSIDELNAKFLSLMLRIDTQVKALSLIPTHFLGYGPQTIVTFLGRDVHNSVVAYLFELGIPGLLLIICSMPRTKCQYSKMTNVLSTFFIFISLTIDMHYSILFVFLLFIIYTENNNILTKKSYFYCSKILSNILSRSDKHG